MAFELDLATNVAKRYCENIINKMNVQQMYLFGSYVSGQSNKDSDIDIAVVSSDFTGNSILDAVTLMKFRRSVDYRIEPHPFRPEDFDSSYPIVNEILTTGIKII